MLFSSESLKIRNTCNDKWKHLSLIKSGVPGTLLKSIIVSLPKQKFSVCRALGVSPKSLPRLYLQRHLSPHLSERVLDILEIYWQIFELYDDTKLVQALLDTSLPALNNEKLSNYAGTFMERRIAKETINKMKFGEFT